MVSFFGMTKRNKGLKEDDDIEDEISSPLEEENEEDDTQSIHSAASLLTSFSIYSTTLRDENSITTVYPCHCVVENNEPHTTESKVASNCRVATPH